MDIVSKDNAAEKATWMWQSNSNPWDDTESPEWQRYSGIENMVIEEAYQTNKEKARLDSYYIDFVQMVQVANNDIHKKRPVKRVTRSLGDSDNVSDAIVSSNIPIVATPSDVNRPGAFGNFIWEAYLQGQWRHVPQSKLVERAAQGILEEGKKLGKQGEAEELAKHLLEVRHGTRKEIWRRCAYLYSLESFLYKKLNETLRLVNSKEHEQVWRNRLETLGLFTWFLFDFPLDEEAFEGIVYRGAAMDDEQIDPFKTALETGEILAFSTFLSASRNRSQAGQYGNTLFIIPVTRSRETSVNVTPFSEYPNEEEQLLIPGFLYKVTRIEFDHTNNKHNIYLQDCNKE